VWRKHDFGKEDHLSEIGELSKIGQFFSESIPLTFILERKEEKNLPIKKGSRG